MATLGIAWLSSACAGGRGGNPASTLPEASATGAQAARPRVEQLPAIVVTPEEAHSVEEIFREGEQAFAEGRWDAAAAAFDRVASVDPEGRLAAPAIFNSGWAHDQAARHEEALARYEATFQRHPSHELAGEARVRAMRLLLYMEQWQRAGALADAVLNEGRDTGDLGRIVAYTAKALVSFDGADPELASPFIERGRAIVERTGLARGGTLHRDVALLYFALGELRRSRGERIVFDPRPADFSAALERRCQLLLDAQSAYSDAMRAYDAHVSAMAGYRVGELYQRLHEDILRIAPPPAADGARAALFEGAMRLRYSVLLRKGLTMMEHTLKLAERTGEDSDWIRRARTAKDQLEHAMEEQQTLLGRLPYTRAELQAALDALRQRAGPAP
jgi:tetratricopeptide (TPR) repeat protein